jgi:hypothetical protein
MLVLRAARPGHRDWHLNLKGIRSRDSDSEAAGRRLRVRLLHSASGIRVPSPELRERFLTSELELKSQLQVEVPPSREDQRATDQLQMSGLLLARPKLIP